MGSLRRLALSIMLYGTVTNERQRQQFQHDTGPLNFGRLPHPEIACVVIEDGHVSRDQLRIEETAEGKIKLENRGRSTVFFRDGSRLSPTETSEAKLPLHLTVGQTIIELSAKPMESPDSSGVRQTIQVDSFMDVAFVALGDITNDFPFPLATGYRQINSMANHAERYKELLRLAENVLAFLGSLSLAVLDDERRLKLNESMGKSVMDCWKGGISPGHWLELTIHSLRLLQQQDDCPLVRKLGSLPLNRENKGPGKVLRSIIEAKNDHKHDRGPSIEPEYRAACVAVAGLIGKLFDSLSFLKEYRMFLVRDINPHRRGDKADVVFLRCMGSNPGFLTEQRVYSPNLRKGDLYIETDLDNLAPLYPFIHATTCNQCRTREFYFIDRMDFESSGNQGSCVAGLKSFDRGHAEKDADLGVDSRMLLIGES